MWNAAEPIALSTAQRSDIEALVRSGRTPQRVVTRARIVLASADGTSINAIASDRSVSRPTVYLWRQRFEQAGIAGLLKDAARPRTAEGRVARESSGDRRRHAAHDAAGCDALECADDGQGAGRQPRHRASHLAGARVAAASRRKRSSSVQDPDFVKKLRDVVGMYLHPPAKALVFCVDEKPQVQALDRTEPVLPLRPGIPARQTHDYIRHGTTNLFAALNVLDGTVLARCAPRKTAYRVSSPS